MLDEAFFSQVGKDATDYAAGVILPDGQYILAKQGHLQTLLELTNEPKASIWERIPKQDSPLFWLIHYTGCVITDENSSVGMTMTESQTETYRALVEHHVIADKYFDITEERNKVAQTP